MGRPVQLWSLTPTANSRFPDTHGELTVQLIRAIAAISMDGRMVVPHVVNPTNLPSGYVEVSRYSDVKNIPVDPNGWNLITDAMSRVLLPEGTAPSAHIIGVDIAGKTGSAQVVSLATRAKHAHDEALAQNGWFVGFTPRRNPDIIVCTLFEGGEHGKLAARIATQVIKAFVDKHPTATREEIARGLGGNFCRCGTYDGIKGAVAQLSKGGQQKGGA